MPFANESIAKYRRSEKGRATSRRYQRAYRAANRDKLNANRRMYTLRKLYGVTPEEYDAQLAKQGGVCAICGGLNESGRKLSVDHDHKTREFRGILCDNCNCGLGNLRDDPEIIKKALEYLCRLQK